MSVYERCSRLRIYLVRHLFSLKITPYISGHTLSFHALWKMLTWLNVSGPCCSKLWTSKLKKKEQDQILILYDTLYYLDFLRTKYIFWTDGQRSQNRSKIFFSLIREVNRCGPPTTNVFSCLSRIYLLRCPQTTRGWEQQEQISNLKIWRPNSGSFFKNNIWHIYTYNQ